MASIKDLTSNFTKLEKFVGIDFRRWQKKMMLVLTTLNVASFLFIVSSIIDKLPPSWRDIRYALKHKREEITLSDLGQHIVVESSEG